MEFDPPSHPEAAAATRVHPAEHLLCTRRNTCRRGLRARLRIPRPPLRLPCTRQNTCVAPRRPLAGMELEPPSHPKPAASTPVHPADTCFAPGRPLAGMEFGPAFASRGRRFDSCAPGIQLPCTRQNTCRRGIRAASHSKPPLRFLCARQHLLCTRQNHLPAWNSSPPRIPSRRFDSCGRQPFPAPGRTLAGERNRSTATHRVWNPLAFSTFQSY
jgi:hypothetical protein